MRTLLIDRCALGFIYRLRDPDAPNEMEFQSWVAKALSCIYSNYECILFDGAFVYDDVCYRPDLAVVARDFSHWFVIEVELVSHSLQKHVLPQVKAFQYGCPSPDCASRLARELKADLERTSTLVEFVPRAVAVVANKRDSIWEIALRAHGIQFLTVSAFGSSTGIDAVELDGALEVVSESLGFGRYSVVDRSLRFHRGLRLAAGQVQINDPAGALAFWRVTPADDATWITKEEGYPDIEDGTHVQLIRTIDGHLSLRRP